MKNKFLVGTLLSSMLLIGIIVGSLFIIGANAESVRTKYELNKQGQTYGNFDPRVPPSEQELPQLIAAIGIDGTEGYVYADDLHGDQPKNEKEANEYMQRLEAEVENAKKSNSAYLRCIPLYLEDGKTIIGEFGISIPVMP